METPGAPLGSETAAAERLRARHPLRNGLTLEVWDLSRPVAGDRYQVVLEARIRIPLEVMDMEGDTPSRKAEIIAALGPELVYTRREERNFIAAKHVPSLLEEMETRLLALAAAYLGHPDFAPRLIHKTIRNIRKNSAGSVN
jgi:hypothetical protein